MSDLASAIAQLNLYQSRYRRADLPNLVVGDLYDLSPELEPPKVPCKWKWPDTWRNSDQAGIYVFLDKDLNVLYVGKAMLLGARLASYCVYGPNRTCHFKHDGWTATPRFLLTVAVPQDMSWEAVGLEEYLIGALDPCDNIRGRIPRADLIERQPT